MMKYHLYFLHIMCLNVAHGEVNHKKLVAGRLQTFYHDYSASQISFLEIGKNFPRDWK